MSCPDVECIASICRGVVRPAACATTLRTVSNNAPGSASIPAAASAAFSPWLCPTAQSQPMPSAFASLDIARFITRIAVTSSPLVRPVPRLSVFAKSSGLARNALR